MRGIRSGPTIGPPPQSGFQIKTPPQLAALTRRIRGGHGRQLLCDSTPGIKA